jgi:putative ABC transport system permease protein
MHLRDFRIGWRLLLQEPAYSLVVVLGLSIGFAACILLLGFVRYSWQYNAQVPDVNNVYVVKQRFNVDPKEPWFDQAPLLLRAEAMKIPGVASAIGFIPSRPQNNKLTVRIDGQLRQLRSLTVLPGFADMLGLQAVRGNLEAALEQPDSFVITEDAAIRFFGTSNVLGRTVQIEGKLLRVGAVLRTPPTNTTIPFEALVGVNSVLMGEGFRDELLTGQKGWWGKLLIRVRPGASLPAITAALQHAVDISPTIQNFPLEMKERLGKRKAMDIVLGPLRYAYFDREVAANFITSAGDRADPVAVIGLGAVALLILALAAINYVNLATVRVLRRQREVAMRKVLGAGARQIILQFLAESMLVATTATGLGLLLAWMALPVFSELMSRQLESIFSFANIGAAVATGCVLGALAAVYPAWIAARIRPTRVLAGRPDTESVRSGRLRRVMTVFQIAAAMSLAGVSLAIAWQTEFAMRASPGFDSAPLLILDLSEAVRESGKAPGFIAALSAQPGVAGVAISFDAVGRFNSGWIRDLKRPGGASVSMEVKAVSANFFEQYRIRPIAGRVFDARIDKEDDPVPVVLNAVAARELGFASPEAALGQTVLFTDNGKLIHKQVVGIAPELRFHSLRDVQGATEYELSSKGETLSVRAAGSVAETERAVEALWRQYFPDEFLELQRAGDIVAANYAEDARLAKLLAVSTGIALAIAAFGIYVLSAYTVQRRAKEVVLRKLYGADRRDIAQLVAREFGLLTAVAALIGLPCAAVAIERYLAGFVERAPIGGWTLAFALAAVLVVATIAVARHAWIAMNMMPSTALRD